jgi:hypothetical protein
LVAPLSAAIPDAGNAPVRPGVILLVCLDLTGSVALVGFCAGTDPQTAIGFMTGLFSFAAGQRLRLAANVRMRGAGAISPGALYPFLQ